MTGKGELDSAIPKPSPGIVGIAVISKTVHVAKLQLTSRLNPEIPIRAGQKEMTVPACGKICLLQARPGISIGEHALDKLTNLLSSARIPGRWFSRDGRNRP